MYHHPYCQELRTIVEERIQTLLEDELEESLNHLGGWAHDDGDDGDGDGDGDDGGDDDDGDGGIAEQFWFASITLFIHSWYVKQSFTIQKQT